MASFTGPELSSPELSFKDAFLLRRIDRKRTGELSAEERCAVALLAGAVLNPIEPKGFFPKMKTPLASQLGVRCSCACTFGHRSTSRKNAMKRARAPKPRSENRNPGAVAPGSG
jgi:hypothetical protein